MPLIDVTIQIPIPSMGYDNVNVVQHIPCTPILAAVFKSKCHCSENVPICICPELVASSWSLLCCRRITVRFMMVKEVSHVAAIGCSVLHWLNLSTICNQDDGALVGFSHEITPQQVNLETDLQQLSLSSPPPSSFPHKVLPQTRLCRYLCCRSHGNSSFDREFFSNVKLDETLLHKVTTVIQRKNH